MDISGNRNKIVDLLIQSNRPGIYELIDYMDMNGFFDAPCSGKYHLCCEGGLAQHSLNVYQTMTDIARTVGNEVDKETIIICALLHDLGKIGDHLKPNYIENIIKDGRPTKAEPEQRYKRSESEPYKTNPNLLYIPHEIRSVAIAERYIGLTEAEEHAILYHNGMYSELKYSYQGKEQPLDLLLHFADMWVCRVTEEEVEEDA